MADYPSSVYAPRTKTNIAGTVYDPLKPNIGYAEDIVYLENEVLAIVADLVGSGHAGGLKGAAADFVTAWLTGHGSDGSHVLDLIIPKSDHAITLGSADYDRLEIADDGTDKIVISKGSVDGNCAILQNAYNNSGTWDNFNTSYHSWYYQMYGDASNALCRWYVAQPTAGAPSWTELMRLTEGGRLIPKIYGFGAAELETIDASGTIAPSQSYVKVETNSGAASDNLDGIDVTPFSEGDIVILHAYDNTHTVVVRDGQSPGEPAQGFKLDGATDFSLDHAGDRIMLQFDGVSWWRELSRSNNA